ncbi:MAG TPA: PAS domain-containing sensor histidine kinase [Pedobacter sp.]|jgi:PAS domain S-box-containing protein
MLSSIFEQESISDFIDNATIGIHSVDASGKIIYANKAELELLGYTEEEYLGRNIYDFHAEKTVLDDIFFRLQQEAKVCEYPARLICKDGSIRDVLINSSAFYRDDKLVHTRCFTRDITDYKKAQAIIRQSEINLHFMADLMPQQVWTAKSDGTLDYVNRRVVDNFQTTAEAVIGEGWIQFVHPDDRQVCIEKWRNALQSGELYQVEFRLKVNNKYKWHLGRAIPLVTDGKIIKWFGTNTDIDDHKRIEAKKDEFISIASHELKTPLTNIKSFIQLAERQLNTPDVALNFLKKADHHVGNLQVLISDLLDVSKINAGMITYNYTDFNFSHLIKESVEAIRASSKKHQIIIESNVDVQLSGDRFRIEQVINNFLTNAIKYSPEADKVILRAGIQQGNLIVSVEDFGIGIKEEHLNKIFDRFYRVDNTAMKYQGLGLGLFISSEIIKRHKGSFWIESVPGKGSIFYFLLPLDNAKSSDVETDEKTYFKSSFIEIFYDPQLKHLEANWIGFQNVDTVKAGGAEMLKILKSNNCQKVLNDNSEVKGNWSEAADWAGEVWFPMMEAAGLKFLAWIYSPSTFSALSAKRSVDVKIGNVVTQFFTRKKDALAWLRSAGD